MEEYLKMKYHPAKKEVEFTRFLGEKTIPVREDSVLQNYMNQKGKFVLQDHGNAFFEDIACAFDGEPTVEIKAVMTKNDFEDFEQMIDFYNKDQNARIQITATLLSELPDMEETYRTVSDFGLQSVKILEKRQKELEEIPQNNLGVKESVQVFFSALQKEIDNIKSKINSMCDNQINLCFTGVYSSGKSTLINAILGYRILPEAIKSETARMFQIQSPNKGEEVRVTFDIGNEYAEIIWDDTKQQFGFCAGPTENAVRKVIQETLEKHFQKPQCCQIFELLKTLNTTEGINSHIKVFFPIPLDTDKVQFTIYDTPGTDSNYVEHQQILQDALQQQTHSILIFVATPDKIEGEGNNALLSYLKNAEKKDKKTSIDIARSLFVINKADTVDSSERVTLQTATIKDITDDTFSINLADKKLFFVSALYAYSARAIKNGAATQDDKYRMEDDYNKLYRPERGRYYQANHVAKSELATQKLIRYSEEKLNKLAQKNDTNGVVEVCSGYYALEREIVAYGEKFAASVRAFAIIDSVEKALASMNNSTGVLKQSNQDNLNKINEEIAELQNAITAGIEEVGKKPKYNLPKEGDFPPHLVKTLHLDSEYIYTNVTSVVKSFIDALLKRWFLGILGKIKVNEEHKKEITEKINSVLSGYTQDFCARRQVALEGLRDNFISDIKEVIDKNGKISEEAKRYIFDICPPEIRQLNNTAEFAALYDHHKRVERILFFKTQYMDKKGLAADVDDKLRRIAENIRKEFEKEFKETLESVVMQIKEEFKGNMEKYCVLVKAKLEAKDEMEKLREKIEETAKDLGICQDKLNSEIWKVV